MPTIFNPKRRNAIFINTGGTVSPTPAPPSFSNTKSLAFDGVDETIDLGLISELNNTSSYTLSMWVNPSVLSGLQYLFALVTSGTERIYIFLNNTIPNVGMSNGTNTNESFNSAPLTIDTWYHLAVVFDGTQTGADRITFYLNGVAETTTKTTWDSTTPTFVTNAFLSNYAQFGLYYFDGNMDEVAIFNTALTSDNINDIYSGGTPNDLSDLNPLAWYRMGDNSTYQTPQILMTENTNKDKVSNYSLQFDGVDDYVNCGNPTELQITGDLSISFWFKTSSASNMRVAGKDSGAAANRNYITIVSGGLVLFQIWKSNFGVAVSTIGTYNDGNWHHAVAVNDGSDLKIYIDGSLENTNVGGGGTIDNDVVDFEIGRRSLPDRYFDGNLDEVAVFNTALTVDNVNDIYNGGTPTTISGATAYWKLGEQSKFTDNWLVPNSALSNYSKYSFNFDGVDDYLNIANDTTIARTQNISYSIWINLTANTRQYLVGNWNSSNGGTGISIESGDVLVFQLADGTNDSFFNSRVTSFSTYAPAGSWHHILGTFDGTDAKIYINGILRNTWTPTTPYTISGWNPFRIGWRGAGLVLLTTGKLNEIGLFDTAINLSDVWDGSGEPKDITSVSGVVSNWRMGEDATYNSSTSEWTIPDQIGSNDGTSSNTMALDTLVGEAPNYFGGGLSDAMTIEDRVGDAPNSENNAVSYNMEAIDIDNNTP